MLLFQNAPFPILDTERVILRPRTPADDQALFRLRSDERVNRFLDRPPTTTLDEARTFIEKIETAIKNGESFYWVLALKKENQLIGTICYWNLVREDDQAEIGYELHPDFQGKGIMQEAVTAVIRFGFEQLKLKTITAFPRQDNRKSIQLLEKNNFSVDSGRQTGEAYVAYVLRANP